MSTSVQQLSTFVDVDYYSWLKCCEVQELEITIDTPLLYFLS